MSKTSSKGKHLRSLPVDRYHPRDSAPRGTITLAAATPRALQQRWNVSAAAARQIVSLEKTGLDWATAKRPRDRALTPAVLDKVARQAVTPRGSRLAIDDVRPAGGRVMSGVPFALLADVHFTPGSEPVLAHVTVLWAGAPFVVEQRVGPGLTSGGQLRLEFGKAHALPPGAAVFLIAVVGADGSQSRFRLSVAVLPSNPLSVSISPRTSFVTGSSSARGVKESGDVYRTRVSIRVSNGDGSAVTIDDEMTWKLWDGGVGGTLVESGTHDWGSNFSIAAFSTWTGNLTFTSPNGSGIYNRYDRKEDMTMELTFRATDGRSIADTITARVMVGFGMNVTRVGDTSWTSTEYADLYNAVDVTEEIYEARDVTYTSISRRHIPDGSIGGYGVIDSENEARSLFDDWSGPDNNLIDVFIVHDHTTGNDGMAGDIPGPTSHAGRSSGVWASKTGFTDSNGQRRLSVDYLGMLIAHEVGHYLGLSHSPLAGNLMLSSSGTNDTDITYDQYRDLLDFGWLFVV